MNSFWFQCVAGVWASCVHLGVKHKTATVKMTLAVSQWSWLCAAVSVSPCQCRLLCVPSVHATPQRQRKTESGRARWSATLMPREDANMSEPSDKVMLRIKFSETNKHNNISVESNAYRADTVQNDHGLLAHGCKGVGFAYVRHDHVHLCPELRLTCEQKHTWTTEQHLDLE